MRETKKTLPTEAAAKESLQFLKNLKTHYMLKYAQLRVFEDTLQDWKFILVIGYWLPTSIYNIVLLLPFYIFGILTYTIVYLIRFICIVSYWVLELFYVPHLQRRLTKLENILNYKNKFKYEEGLPYSNREKIILFVSIIALGLLDYIVYKDTFEDRHLIKTHPEERLNRIFIYWVLPLVFGIIVFLVTFELRD